MTAREHFRFGTKAETLEALKALSSHYWIPPFVFFSRQQWKDQPQLCGQLVEQQLGRANLAVRSSALMEDGAEHSGAGENDSHLQVPFERLAPSVQAVFESYRQPHSQDQVLVQHMVEDLAVIGVITTYVVDDGSPYITVSYDDESGQPDAITGGVGVHKTVLVHRDTPDWMMDSPRLRRWVGLARELELLCHCAALDIEFAETHSGRVCLLQVRRITTTSRWSGGLERRVQNILTNLTQFLRQRSRPRQGLLGARTLLGEMPDWNPAEIIGTNPRLLASSLYRWLVTDTTWAEARAKMGYRHVHQRLMVTLAGRPFIDVRNSFNSFLPESLDPQVGELLVNAWLHRLERTPELHDKVEFEVALTAYDFSFEEKLDRFYPNLLSSEYRDHFRTSLRELTAQALTGETLAWARQQVDQLPRGPFHFDGEDDLLALTEQMLSETRQFGTLPFAVAARHAFIAENLLRSAVSRQALSAERLGQLKRSFPTITRTMAAHWREVMSQRLSKEEFLHHYGHLRPGTYDILSLRYDQRPQLFEGTASLAEPEEVHFELSQEEEEGLKRLLSESQFPVTPRQLVQYCAEAIAAREELKFHFTRHLSNALEVLLRWAELQGLGREPLSHLSLFQLLGLRENPIVERPASILREWSDHGAEELQLTRALRIGYLLRNERDLYVAPMHRAAPNFITSKRVEGPITVVDAQTPFSTPLAGTIVCIENADPGFDWLFSRGLIGLVTCHGGANSHMGVRSAELGLPAALGCGEQLFRSLASAHRVVLNCGAKSVRPLEEL